MSAESSIHAALSLTEGRRESGLFLLPVEKTHDLGLRLRRAVIVGFDALFDVCCDEDDK